MNKRNNDTTVRRRSGFLVVTAAAMLLTGCSTDQFHRTLVVLNNPLAAAVDRDVGTFRTPAGPVELSASRLGGHTQFEELETGQTFKVPHMTHASLVKRYRTHHMTDVVVEGRAPGCRHETLFAEFRKQRMADSIPRTCAAYRYKFDGTGITAIEKNAPDPKVYRFAGMHLSGPLRMSQLDPNYRHDRMAKHKAHHAPPVKAIAAHPDHKATHMSRPIVPGRARQGPAPKTPSTPTLNLG